VERGDGGGVERGDWEGAGSGVKKRGYVIKKSGGGGDLGAGKAHGRQVDLGAVKAPEYNVKKAEGLFEVFGGMRLAHT
jgi:hypothetical protein